MSQGPPVSPLACYCCPPTMAPPPCSNLPRELPCRCRQLRRARCSAPPGRRASSRWPSPWPSSCSRWIWTGASSRASWRSPSLLRRGIDIKVVRHILERCYNYRKLWSMISKFSMTYNSEDRGLRSRWNMVRIPWDRTRFLLDLDNRALPR